MKATAKSGNTITVVRAVESCIGDDSQNPKTFEQISHNFKEKSMVSISMTA
jgi:hypothetical protein